MLSPTLIRLGAPCGIVAGLFIAVPAAFETVLGETAATSFVLGLAPALATPTLVALYARHSEEAGRFGAIAYLVNLLGLGLFGGAAFTLNMALFYLDGPVVAELLRGPTKLALTASASVFALGSVLFGLSLLRAKIHPRLPSSLYVVVPAAFALAAPLPDTLFTSGLHILFGLTLGWLSTSMWRSQSAARWGVGVS